jgi:glycine dehydrogenase subunit 1
MLASIGVPSIDALFDVIPGDVRLGRPLAIEPALDEARLMDHMGVLAEKSPAARALSFLGGGIYEHHVPPAVDQLLLRGEFYTAYTPYQAEVAQGTLQAIFEFQTIVSELFGMPIANASMYDGASAAAEAVLMARRLTKRTHVLVSGGVHPEYLETIRTYVRGLPGGTEAIELLPIGANGTVDLAVLDKALARADEDGASAQGAARSTPDNQVACVVIGYPNFFGCVLGPTSPSVRGRRSGSRRRTAAPGAACSRAATAESSSRTSPAAFAGRPSIRTDSAGTS